MTAVHQVLPVLSAGDAIGAAVLRTQAMLRERGIGGGIFAEVVDPRLGDVAGTVDDLDAALHPGDALNYHLSIGAAVARRVVRPRVPLVVTYHNITPARYYRGTSDRVTYWLERGRDDLRELCPQAALVIGDSPYNLAEAVAAGARRTAVVPPPVDLDRLRPRPARPVDPPVILFVGRMAPNKRHDTLLRALAALRATTHPTARLVCAGTADDTGAHRARLQDLAARLGVADAADLGGERRPDAEIGDLYAGASVFATASEHEGFCVPLLEAMAFEVPVVAAAEAAIPDTVADAGLLVPGRDPLVWAEALGRAIDDDGLRRELVARGRRRVRAHAEPAVAERLVGALRDAGIVGAER